MTISRIVSVNKTSITTNNTTTNFNNTSITELITSIFDEFLDDLEPIIEVTEENNIDSDLLYSENPGDTEDTIINYIDLLDGSITGGSDDGITFQNVKSAFIVTGSGNDNINISATVEDSTVGTGAGNDTIVGGSGNDYINSGTGNDVITSGAGNDEINAGRGNDRVNTGSGNDRIEIGTGADTVDGGTGNDFLYFDNFTNTANTTINYTTLLNGTVVGGSNNGTTFKNIESVDFSTGSGNDTINVAITTGSNLLNSGAGNDTIVGGSGNDNINSGAGNDSVTSGTGNDIVNAGAGNDTVNAGAGNDSINAEAGNDTVNGDAGNDRIDGGDGNDTLNGGTGTDTLIGGAGNDSLNGGAGNDTMIGGAGNDTYVVDSLGDVVTEAAVNGGIDTVTSSVNYTLVVNVENLILTGAANGTGNSLNNIITGGTGNNVINGGAGLDTINGGGGLDTINGGTGNDTLNGGVGNDTLTGGAGRDTFVFSGNPLLSLLNAIGTDTITDLTLGTAGDKIQLSKAYFTALSGAPGALAAADFRTVTTDAAAATSIGEIVYNSANGKLFYNADGNDIGFGTNGGQFAQLNTGLALTAGSFTVGA